MQWLNELIFCDSAIIVNIYTIEGDPVFIVLAKIFEKVAELWFGNVVVAV